MVEGNNYFNSIVLEVIQCLQNKTLKFLKFLEQDVIVIIYEVYFWWNKVETVIRQKCEFERNLFKPNSILRLNFSFSLHTNLRYFTDQIILLLIMTFSFVFSILALIFVATNIFLTKFYFHYVWMSLNLIKVNLFYVHEWMAYIIYVIFSLNT